MLQEPSRSLSAPPGALDETEAPDPQFWGRAEPRRHRRRSGPAERSPSGTDRRIAVFAVVAVAIAAAALSLRSSASPPPARATTRTAAVRARPRRVIVHVAGAVTRPGVVDLPDGARVIDAVDAAGGALAAADLNQINLAAPLRDGEQVLVPLNGSPPTTAAPSP